MPVATPDPRHPPATGRAGDAAEPAGTGGAVRTILTMVVREGCERSFEETWAAAALAIRRRPGNIDQALLRDLNRPRSYVITAGWRNLAALRAFESSPERRALSERLEHLREAVDKAVFDVVMDIDGEEGGSS